VRIIGDIFIQECYLVCRAFTGCAKNAYVAAAAGTSRPYFSNFAWMELLQKLRVNISKPIWVIEPPMEIADILPGADIRLKLGKEKPVAQLMLFAKDSKTLMQYLQVVADYIGHDTLFWICYPKKTGAIQSDLVMMETWDIVFNSGYRGLTSVSISDDWTGMRFTNAPRKKPSKAELPMEDRKTEGVDYINRTTVLPPDAVAVMMEHKGLVAFFNGMSFSHKREYIESIEEAKKPETRERRIIKMTEMVLRLMAEKDVRKGARLKSK
jgi:hypothetical protein